MRKVSGIRAFSVAACALAGLLVLSACGSSSAVPGPAAIGAALAAASATGLGVTADGGASSEPGAGADNGAAGTATTNALAVVNDKGRFVDMALDPATGKGVAIDIYLGSNAPGLYDVQAGNSINSMNPKPEKWVTGLAFGTATAYIGVPESSIAFVTAAGDTTILNGFGDGGAGEIYAADGMSSDDPNYASEALEDTYVIRGGTNQTSDKDLEVEQKHEADDPNWQDGGDLPIADKAVIFASMPGTTAVDTSGNNDAGADERQLGIVGAPTCLPEVHNLDIGRHDSYMAVGVDQGVEYATGPGSAILGVWATGDEAVCKGTPTGTVTGQWQAGDRYYLMGYGPAPAPKFLVLTVPAPKNGKTATPTPDQG